MQMYMQNYIVYTHTCIFTSFTPITKGEYYESGNLAGKSLLILLGHMKSPRVASERTAGMHPYKRGCQICQRGSMGKNMEKLSHGFRGV